MIEEFFSLFQQEVFLKSWNIVLGSWPIWLPILVLNLSFGLWLDYIRRAWTNKQGYVLLEIKLPKDQPKSPAAMEFVLQGIWENANISNPADAFWEGKLREWFSLEIVALNGQIRFFIWAFPRWKKIIESRIYAQYPGAEVAEVKDYAPSLEFDPRRFYHWGIGTELAQPDPYPINTYIEYELDKKKGDEQEEIVDPLTPVLEYMGTMGPHEFAGIQILIRAHAKENYLYGRWVTKKDWNDDIQSEIKKIIEEKTFVKPEEGKPPTMMALSEEQKRVIKAMERNGAKLAFDTTIRMVYVAPADNYDKTRGMGLIGSTRQFGAKNMNGIKPKLLGLSHAWQDFNDIVKNDRQKKQLEAYKRRAYFGPAYHHLWVKPYILSTEELATVFHLPGAVATTPNLVRAPSKKAEAPANLPV